MAIPVPYRFCSGVACVASVTAPVAWVAIVLCGCSINLGSLSSSAEREEPAQLTSQSNIASLTEAIKNNPNDPQAYNMRGSVLAQAGRTEEALADFNKAVSLDANYGQAFANRGLIYRKTKQFDQAMDDYNRALALDPNYAPAYLGRGVVYKARKQDAEALEDFNKAISLHPDMRRPVTIAACSIRARSNISSRSTTSRWRAV
jgi:tetratricopeptide (TPR) repeat protein